MSFLHRRPNHENGWPPHEWLRAHWPHPHMPHLHRPHLHMPHLHMPHLHMPHLHMPHFHAPRALASALHLPHVHVSHPMAYLALGLATATAFAMTVSERSLPISDLFADLPALFPQMGAASEALPPELPEKWQWMRERITFDDMYLESAPNRKMDWNRTGALP